MVKTGRQSFLTLCLFYIFKGVLEMAVETKLQVMTPKEATMIIEISNFDNRKIRQKNVLWLSDLIKKGEWVVTHQGIAFDVNGRLIDGQHRLLAIAKSGIDTPILVTRNIEPEAFTAIDTHSRRNLADVYRISRQYSAFISTLSKLINHHAPKFNHAEITNVILKTSELFETYAGKANVKFFSSGSVTSALIYSISKHSGSEEYVTTLYRNLRLANYLEMPAIGHAFHKSLAMSKDFQVRNTVIPYQMLYVFDPANENSTKIRSCSSEVTESFKAWIHELIKD